MTVSFAMTAPWHLLLDQAVAPQRVWRDLLAQEFDGVSRFLAATGDIADFVACPKTAATGCGLRVSPAADGSMVGVCTENECARTSFSRSDLAIMKVDWATLLAALGQALGLSGHPDQVGSLPAAAQVGWIAPAQTARCPVFFCAPTKFSPLFPHLQRFAERAAGEPFALILPSRTSVDTDSAGLMNRRKAEMVVLEEAVSMDANGRLLAKEAAVRLTKFALAAGGITAVAPGPRFPTPEGARWRDFKITAIDQHTIEIHASVRTRSGPKQATESYSFSDFGFTKRSGKGVKPSVDWENFLIQIVQHRRVVAESPRAWGALKNSKEHVAAALKDLTEIDPDDAFISYPGRRCYEAGFNVACSPAEETPVPDAPRRLNQKGEVARNRRDE